MSLQTDFKLIYIKLNVYIYIYSNLDDVVAEAEHDGVFGSQPFVDIDQGFVAGAGSPFRGQRVVVVVRKVRKWAHRGRRGRGQLVLKDFLEMGQEDDLLCELLRVVVQRKSRHLGPFPSPSLLRINVDKLVVPLGGRLGIKLSTYFSKVIEVGPYGAILKGTNIHTHTHMLPRLGKKALKAVGHCVCGRVCVMGFIP